MRTVLALAASLIIVTTFASCTSSAEDNADAVTAAAAESTAGDVLPFETDVDALREIYPMGDLAIDSVRWRLHTDFVATAEGGSRVIDDLPAQDADPVLEIIFVFEDDSMRESLLAGRTTTLSDVPNWYPPELTSANSPTVAVATSAVEGLPGEVSVFPDVAPFVRVQYQP